MTFEIRTAAELVDPAIEARWAARRSPPQADVLQSVLRRFVAGGGPVSVEEIRRAVPDRSPAVVVQTLATLDREDLLVLRDGHIVVAYPFSAAPTPFVVLLPGVAPRYACCAIDALGIAAMLRQRIEVRSACHHCQEPLVFPVDAEGPWPEAAGLMVWVGRQDDGTERRCGML